MNEEVSSAPKSGKKIQVTTFALRVPKLARFALQLFICGALWGLITWFIAFVLGLQSFAPGLSGAIAGWPAYFLWNWFMLWEEKNARE